MAGFESYQRARPSLNLSALIDVVFILVIFIVLVAHFDKVRDLEIRLPQAHASGEPPAEALELVIPPDGPLRLGAEELTLDALQSVLRPLRERHDTLRIVADAGTAFERAVQALTEAQAAGFVNISIATQAKQATP